MHICRLLKIAALQARPVSPPHVEQSIIYGTDLREGGTWMGYNRDSRVLVALTNVRHKEAPTPKNGVSRGKLVLNILKQEGITLNDIKSIAHSHRADAGALSQAGSATAGTDASVGAQPSASSIPALLDLGAEYGPCNLLVAELSGGESEAFFLSNCHFIHDKAGTAQHQPGSGISGKTGTGQSLRFASVERVSAGCHALSNSGLDDARWPKVAWLKQQLESVQSDLPLLEELHVRYGAQKRAVGTEHASDMGQAGSVRGVVPDQHQGDGSASSLTSASEAQQVPAATASIPPEHSRHHHHHQRDQDSIAMEAEGALVEAVLNRIVPLMTRQESVLAPTPSTGEGGTGASSAAAGDTSMADQDLSWSTLPHNLEAQLQQRVFIPRMQSFDYGTRALTVVMQVKNRATYYCYSSFDVENPDVVPKQQAAIQTASHAAASQLARAMVQQPTGQGQQPEQPFGAIAAAIAGSLASSSTSSSTASSAVSTGSMHESVRAAESAAVHGAVVAAGQTGMGAGVELVHVPMAEQTGSVPHASFPATGAGTSVAAAAAAGAPLAAPGASAHQHPHGRDAHVMVAGVKWAIFRVPC